MTSSWIIFFKLETTGRVIKEFFYALKNVNNDNYKKIFPTFKTKVSDFPITNYTLYKPYSQTFANPNAIFTLINAPSIY